MSWILLTVIQALVEAISNIYDRYVLKNRVKTFETLIIFWGIFSLIMFCTPAILTNSITVETPVILLGFASGLLYVLAMYFYYQAVNRAEVDRIIPVLSLNPIFILLGATIFFQEFHNLNQYIGIVLIIFGILIDSFDRQHHKFIDRKAIIFMAAAALFFAAKSLLAKSLSLGEISPLNILFWIGIGGFIFSAPFIIKNRKKVPRTPREIVEHCLAGSLSVATSLLYTTAIMIGPAALVAFLQRINVFFVFIISQIIDLKHPQVLREKFVKKAFLQKLFGVMIILIGSFFLI